MLSAAIPAVRLLAISEMQKKSAIARRKTHRWPNFVADNTVNQFSGSRAAKRSTPVIAAEAAQSQRRLEIIPRVQKFQASR